jgi:hypothetical protein
MSYKVSEDSEAVENLGDRYRNGGRDMTLQSALAAVQAQMGLTGQQAEEFAKLFRLQNERLVADFRNQTESRALLPPTLPKPIKRPTLKEFKAHGITKRRAMTGCEAAEHAAPQAEQTVLSQASKRRTSLSVQYPTIPIPSHNSEQSPEFLEIPQTTGRKRKPSAKVVAEMEAKAARKESRKRSKKRLRKGDKIATEAAMSRRKRQKVPKEDETQLELQQVPTQECILVDTR